MPQSVGDCGFFLSARQTSARAQSRMQLYAVFLFQEVTMYLNNSMEELLAKQKLEEYRIQASNFRKHFYTGKSESSKQDFILSARKKIGEQMILLGKRLQQE